MYQTLNYNDREYPFFLNARGILTHTKVTKQQFTKKTNSIKQKEIIQHSVITLK